MDKFELDYEKLEKNLADLHKEWKDKRVELEGKEYHPDHDHLFVYKLLEKFADDLLTAVEASAKD